MRYFHGMGPYGAIYGADRSLIPRECVVKKVGRSMAKTCKGIQWNPWIVVDPSPPSPETARDLWGGGCFEEH